MAARREVFTVYAAGLIQGVALVTFPAANAVFTNAQDYGLSNTQYGGLFVPQAVLAIVASLLGAALRKRAGIRLIYLMGLVANLLAMSLLVASACVMKDHSLAYGILLAATGCLGVGFGLTVPALNTFASAFFPKKTDRAVLVLNALLGLGTALAPVFIAIFVGAGIWWGLPALMAVLLVGLLLFSVSLPLGAARSAHSAAKHRGQIPARFWIFASFALLYGVCETMNGNWAVPYMTKHFGVRAFIASLALASFWGVVTGGRLLFAGMEKWFPERMVCRVLPFVVAAAFAAIAFGPQTNVPVGILLFALSGLGCSALLPLTISFAQKELTTIAASAAGGLIAFYQVGYGVAAFGVGPLQSWAGFKLASIYGGAAFVALAMAVLSFVVTRKHPTS
ncbi:MAG: MFS transporter [Opitutaceae bacterium]